jgi:transcriptional regulator with XRE-family HTH domain
MTVVEALKIRIENLLKERNITLYRLAQNAGMYHGSLMKIIGQKNVSANLLTLIQIANGFNMTVGEFLTDLLFESGNFDID